MTQEKTHWKKNSDSAFIAGEDLQASLKGLKPEMKVEIVRFSDAKSFDQNKQVDKVVTSLFLASDGKELYKPAVLNKTNAKFLIKEFGSEYVDDWIGKPFTMYAQKDPRHGYVVRFRKWAKQNLTVDMPAFAKCREAYLADPASLDKIKAKYVVSQDVERVLIEKTK